MSNSEAARPIWVCCLPGGKHEDEKRSGNEIDTESKGNILKEDNLKSASDSDVITKQGTSSQHADIQLKPSSKFVEDNR